MQLWERNVWKGGSKFENGLPFSKKELWGWAGLARAADRVPTGSVLGVLKGFGGAGWRADPPLSGAAQAAEILFSATNPVEGSICFFPRRGLQSGVPSESLKFPGNYEDTPVITVRLKSNLYFPTERFCVRKYCDAACALSPGVDGASARLPDKVKAVRLREHTGWTLLHLTGWFQRWMPASKYHESPERA